jgi:hypothetical protein
MALSVPRLQHQPKHDPPSLRIGAREGRSSSRLHGTVAARSQYGDDRQLTSQPVASRKTPPWHRPSPAKVSQPLTAPQKAAAKARADTAGRRYPNLVDNMWAPKQPRGAPAASSKDDGSD